MSNKIIFQAETDVEDIIDCIKRMEDVIYSKVDNEPLGSKYIITITRKEEE